jgi:LPXTG-site transpeptidase (sortase) family protein
MRHSLRSALLVVAASAALVSGCGNEVSAPERPAAATIPAPTVAVPPQAPPPLPAPVHVGVPTLLEVPAIGVREQLTGVGLKPDGAMQTPAFGKVGWYDRGPRPGASGPAVVVAHVHGPAGDDVFARLHELRPGDRVTVRRTDGSTTFVVDAVQQVAKESLPYERIWKRSPRALLRLITCGGEPDPVTRMYPDNTIVYAHAVSTISALRSTPPPAARASR